MTDTATMGRGWRIAFAVALFWLMGCFAYATWSGIETRRKYLYPILEEIAAECKAHPDRSYCK
jgi:hypothetical protein